MTPMRWFVALLFATLCKVQALDVRRVPTFSVGTSDGAEPPAHAATSAMAAPTDKGPLPAAVAQSDEAEVRHSSRGVCDNLNWGVLVALVFLNAFGFFAQSATGFGENIIVQTGWHILALCHVGNGNLVEVLIILTASNIPIMALEGWILRSHINWSLVLVLTAASLPPCVLGVYIVYKFQVNVWLMRVLGMVLLFVVLWFLFTAESECCRPAGERSSGPTEDIGTQEDGGAQQTLHGGAEEHLEVKPQRPPYDTFGSCARFCSPAFWGFFSGLLGGLFGVTGPPQMIFVLCEQIPKDEWRGTGTVINVINMLVRGACLIGFAVSGMAGTNLLPPPCQQTLNILDSILFGLVGLLLGNCFSYYISEKWFRRALLVFMLVGGISLVAKT